MLIDKIFITASFLLIGILPKNTYYKFTETKEQF